MPFFLSCPTSSQEYAGIFFFQNAAIQGDAACGNTSHFIYLLPHRNKNHSRVIMLDILTTQGL
jgi:hypothetical protein